jgi:hypothetical protein
MTHRPNQQIIPSNDVIGFATAAGYQTARNLLTVYDNNLFEQQKSPYASLRTALRSVENEAGFPELADIVKNLRDAAKLRLATHYSPAEPPLGRHTLDATIPLIVEALSQLIDRTSLAASALVTTLDHPKTGATPPSLEQAAQTLPAAARACLQRMVSGVGVEPAQNAIRSVRAVVETGHSMAFT